MEKSKTFILRKIEEAVGTVNEIRFEIINPSHNPEKLEDLLIKARELCYIGYLLTNELRLKESDLKNIDTSPPYDYV